MEYLGLLNLSIDQIIDTPRNMLRSLIRIYDTEEWRRLMFTKKTLSLYIRFKPKIIDEHIYDNRKSSEILSKATANVL